MLREVKKPEPIDYEAENLLLSIDANTSILDEKLWYTYLNETRPDPYSLHSGLAELLKAAYHRIKWLERNDEW